MNLKGLNGYVFFLGYPFLCGFKEKPRGTPHFEGPLKKTPKRRLQTRRSLPQLAIHSPEMSGIHQRNLHRHSVAKTLSEVARQFAQENTHTETKKTCFEAETVQNMRAGFALANLKGKPT